MNNFEQQYLDLLQKVINTGEERADRTGVGTKSVFGGQLTFDLTKNFPIMTIKKTLWKSAFIEMLWFIRGEPNTKFLKEHGVPIWDDWADSDGNLGPVYGVQWRKWQGKPSIHEKTGELLQQPIDQLKDTISSIISNPTGRRHIVTAWNPAYINEMGLPPCHRDFQCYASNDGYLDLMMSQRSWDLGLGAPFNIAQYALLTYLIARATNRKPRFLKINYGDAHLYLNHIDPIKNMLSDRAPVDCKIELNIKTENTDIDGYKIEDFEITGYQHHDFVRLPIAV